MNIGLIGYGKMGKEIERIAQERGFPVVQTFDSKTAPLSKQEASGIDVGIHFTASETVLEDVEHWAGMGKNLVIGTTGWSKDLGAVSAVVKKAGTGLLYASNFSIGVNILFRLAKELGTLVNALPQYDLSIHEVHHKEKADSPSGTALTLANIFLDRVKRKKEILGGPPGKIRPDHLQVSSSRLGTVIGTHTVAIDSGADSLELTHRAKNRSGFAFGALLAAEWILNKKGLYTMDDLFDEILHSSSYVRS